MRTQIENKLRAGLEGISYLEVIDESSRHNVPPGAESHFKVTIVSEAFEGIRLLARHRMINDILSEELANRIHALAIHAYTEREWRAKSGDAPKSPPCLGGSKTDAGQPGRDR
jgi:BolA protein